MATHRRDSVADVLGNIAHVNSHIGALLVELLNQPDEARQAGQLRELGRHVGQLSAELLARAAETEGRHVEAPSAVVIDARPEHPAGAGDAPNERTPSPRTGWARHESARHEDEEPGMGYMIDFEGIVYDHPSGVRIGVVNEEQGSILLDEDVYRTDNRYADEPPPPAPRHGP